MTMDQWPQVGPDNIFVDPIYCIQYPIQYNILVWLLGCFFFSQKILVWLLGWGVFSQNILGCLLVWNFLSYKILAWLLGWFYFPIKYWIGYYVDFSFYRIYCFGYCVGFSFHRKYWVCYCVVVYLHIKYCFVYWSTTEIMYWVLIVLLTIHSQSVPSCSAYKIRVCVWVYEIPIITNMKFRNNDNSREINKSTGMEKDRTVLSISISLKILSIELSVSIPAD